MTVNLANLAAQGRAFSPSRPWEPEELDALITLEKERKLARTIAADYIRNGIMTVEAFDKATKNEFVPKTLEEAAKETEAALKENGEKAVEKVKEEKQVVKRKK